MVRKYNLLTFTFHSIRTCDSCVTEIEVNRSKMENCGLFETCQTLTAQVKKYEQEIMELKRENEALQEQGELDKNAMQAMKDLHELRKRKYKILLRDGESRVAAANKRVKKLEANNEELKVQLQAVTWEKEILGSLLDFRAQPDGVSQSEDEHCN